MGEQIKSVLGADVSNVLSKTAWTFLQSFGALIAGSESGVVDIDVLKSAFLAGISAAITVVTVYARRRVAQVDIPTFDQ